MDEPSQLTDPPLPRVVAVRLRHDGPVHEFDAGTMQLHAHDRVLVETDRGPVLGTVVATPIARRPRRRLRPVIAPADARDLAHEDTDAQRTQQILRTALGVVRSREVPIKLVKIERDDAGKTTIVYTCEDKFQHRDLARDLAHELGMPVDMRHVGARDEARVTGGVGVCGRELCCSSWLKNFEGVTVKMAKAQNLSLNFSKLAGQCGRLKCCLRYEYQTYLDLKRALPAIGAQVETVKGNGKVVSQQLLAQTVRILREDDELVEVTLEDLVERRPDA